MRGMQEIAVGDAAYFHGLRCRVKRTEADGGLCLELIGQTDAAWLVPLFMQDVCRIETAGGALACLAEVVERYHCENAYRMRLAVKSGFYGNCDHTVQTRRCRLAAQLMMRQDDGLPVQVESISVNEAQLVLSDVAKEAWLTGDADAHEAILLVEGLALPGVLPAEANEADTCRFQIAGADEKTLQKLLERVIFRQEPETAR